MIYQKWQSERPGAQLQFEELARTGDIDVDEEEIRAGDERFDSLIGANDVAPFESLIHEDEYGNQVKEADDFESSIMDTEKDARGVATEM